MVGDLGRIDHCFALGIERDNGDRIPIACVTRPALRVSGSRLYVHSMPSGEDVAVFTGMTLRRAYVTDPTVFVIVVVPIDECSCPDSRFLQIRKALCRELRSVLGRAKQGFAESVIVADSRA